jgi:hypothetical protein
MGRGLGGRRRLRPARSRGRRERGNVCDFFFDSIACPDDSNLGDGTNPLVIDEDGTIVADFFGAAAKFTTLGFASIIGSDPSSGRGGEGGGRFQRRLLE